jgi:hypothetical protein
MHKILHLIPSTSGRKIGVFLGCPEDRGQLIAFLIVSPT